MSTSPVPSSSSPSSIIHRRMSFIREVSSKSSSSYQTPSQSSSTSIPPPPIQPPLQTQQTTSSTVTDPSFEDTTSEQPFDTASELYSQSFETNIDSSNPKIVDDQDDDPNSPQHSLTYDERQRRLSLTSKPIKPFAQPLSALPMRIAEQHHSESLPSPEASIDVSMVGQIHLFKDFFFKDHSLRRIYLSSRLFDVLVRSFFFFRERKENMRAGIR